MNKKIKIFTEIGNDAAGVVTALRNNYNIDSVEFNNRHCAVTWIKKRMEEREQSDLFICSDCKKVEREKPENDYCKKCGQRVKFKKISFEKLLSKIVKE